MSILYLAGRDANAIEGVEEVTVSSEDSLYLKERAYDGFPGGSFKYNVAAADDTYDIDLNRVFNGDMEDWAVLDVPDHWTDASSGTGTLIKETTFVHSGSSSLRLDGGGGGNAAICQRNHKVLSGWEMTVDLWLLGDGVNTTFAKIICLETGQYLQIGGTWTLTPTNFFTRTASSWAQGKVVFNVPAFSTTLRHKVTIQIVFTNVTGQGFADDIALWPSVDFASIHGHNLGSNIILRIQSDTDPAYGSVVERGVPTIRRPSFYKDLGSLISDRYWRFKAEGTNFESIRYGELVLGQYKTLSLDFQPGSEIKFTQPRSTLEGANTQIQVINLSDDPVREYLLQFIAITEAQKDEIRDQILLRSGHGKDPLIIVPDTNNSDVIYGRYVEDDWSYTRTPFGSEAKGSYTYSIRVREDPLGKEIL